MSSGAWRFYVVSPARVECGGVRRESDGWPLVYHWLRHYGINTEALISGKASRESWREVRVNIKRSQTSVESMLCGQRERWCLQKVSSGQLIEERRTDSVGYRGVKGVPKVPGNKFTSSAVVHDKDRLGSVFCCKAEAECRLES
jgi:hypothetical protein